MVQIEIINKSKHSLPQYETEHSAGMDLRANLENDLMLEPLARIAVPTGLFVKIPVGYEAQVRPRSGLALRNGVTLINSPGTIDADYRGEIQVLLVNISNQRFFITDGMRIAQMVIAPCAQAQLLEVEFLDSTPRGSGGFGHTGID